TVFGCEIEGSDIIHPSLVAIWIPFFVGIARGDIFRDKIIAQHQPSCPIPIAEEVERASQWYVGIGNRAADGANRRVGLHLLLGKDTDRVFIQVFLTASQRKQSYKG